MKTLTIKEILSINEGEEVCVTERTTGKFVNWLESCNFVCVKNDENTMVFKEVSDKFEDSYKSKGLKILYEGGFNLNKNELNHVLDKDILYSNYKTALQIEKELKNDD